MAKRAPRMKPRHNGKCKRTGKIKWGTRLEAQMASAHVVGGVYYCDGCRCWHLTRQPGMKGR